MENGATLLDGQLTSADAFAVIDLATGFGDEVRAGSRIVDRLSRERISAPPSRRGSAPRGDDGHPVELHHDQKSGEVVSELTRTDHRLGENFRANHDNVGTSSSNVDRREARRERERYWREEQDRGRFDE